MKNNLLFDLNYILYKTVYVLFKNNLLYGKFHEAMDNNIIKYTSMNKWDKVYIVSDSKKKSWRKKFLDEYKAHRTKTDDIDWKWVFEQYDLWKENNKDKYTILEADHIEGDDWISSLCFRNNKNNESNCIISSDCDYNQLLNYKIAGKNSFINIQIVDNSGKEKIYIPIGWQIWLKEAEANRNNDPFELDNGSEWLTFFNKITNQWEYEEVDSYEKLFVKLVQGDKSDNIKSIYEKLTTTGKIQGIGKAGAEKIWNFYKQNYKEHFSTKEKTFIDDLVNCVEKIYNIELSEERVDMTIARIKQNIKLIELHYRHLPDWVVETIIEKIDESV